MTYDAGSIGIQEIREFARYRGLRVTLLADLDGARCNVQLDVGYGDAVTPAPVEVECPTLLEGLPAPRLLAYPRESVFAEKLEAIAQLGVANSRLKDYFDLLALAREGAMNMDDLSRAIAATFERRGTVLPDPLPVGLTEAFARDVQKQKQWSAFLARNRIEAPALDVVIAELAGFLRVPLREAMRPEPTRGPV